MVVGVAWFWVQADSSKRRRGKDFFMIGYEDSNTDAADERGLLYENADGRRLQLQMDLHGFISMLLAEERCMCFLFPLYC